MANLSPSKVFPSLSIDEKTGAMSVAIPELTTAPTSALDPVDGNFGLFLSAVVEKGYATIEKLEPAEKPKGYSIVKNSETVVPGVINSRRIVYLVTFDSVAPSEQYQLIS